MPVEPGAAERALAPLTVADWAAAGLVAVEGDGVTGLIRLRPLASNAGEWLMPNDSSRRTEHVADHVIGVGAASLTLAGMTVRAPVARCLDLGSGSGIQSLLASSHAAEVVATDRNSRAVAFVRFTMALNAVDNVEARHGDLFEPVAGERFGLIVSNPPFVISPDDRFAYRDSGLPGDEICRRIVAGAPAHLEEGGWCQLLANWAHLKGVDWRERLATWFEGTGCDAWVIQRDVQDVESYASTWIGHDETTPSHAPDAFDTWMDHYERTSTEAIGIGLITLRRSGSPTPWLRIDELPQDFTLPCGDAIASPASTGAGGWVTTTASCSMPGSRSCRGVPGPSPALPRRSRPAGPDRRPGRAGHGHRPRRPAGRQLGPWPDGDDRDLLLRAGRRPRPALPGGWLPPAGRPPASTVTASLPGLGLSTQVTRRPGEGSSSSSWPCPARSRRR
ncbi:MAG: methyltransferase [Acidimicrobiales bacterium]